MDNIREMEVNALRLRAIADAAEARLKVFRRVAPAVARANRAFDRAMLALNGPAPKAARPRAVRVKAEDRRVVGFL